MLIIQQFARYSFTPVHNAGAILNMPLWAATAFFLQKIETSGERNMRMFFYF
jgi:hypothetical protein